MNRLRISLKRDAAIEVDRISIGSLRLAYLICADRKLRYPNGRSRIAYIGTTKTGFQRVAQSAASQADKVLNLHGVRKFRVHVVTCSRRKHVETWKKLERALLIAFQERFGDVPKCNTHGKHYIRTIQDEKRFRWERLETVVDDLS